MQKLEDVKRTCVEVFLVPFEGTGPMTSDGRFMAYPDPGNKKTGLPITIAWGLTYHADGRPIELGELWDREYALKVKSIVLNRFLMDLLKMSPGLIQENSLRIAAVLSWVYNLGLGNYRVSTFKKRIDSKDWNGAYTECLKWNKAQGRVMKGLTRRRIAEATAIKQ